MTNNLLTHKLFVLYCFAAISLNGCQSILPAPTQQSAPVMTTVSIIGRGTTKEDAIQDALRNAVEKATGVFVYSTTDVENFQLVKDKIVTASRGYVKDYKITEDKKYEDIIILTVNVTVNDEAIK